MKKTIVAALVCAVLTACSAAPTSLNQPGADRPAAADAADGAGALRDQLAAVVPPGTGVSLAWTSGKQAHAALVGADSLTPSHTFRLASNTKTYVAAAVLRLWEDGKIDLDASMRQYVDPAYIRLLDGDGYDTKNITVRQLLTHTGGIADHTMTKQFDEVLATHPETAWTLDSQFDALVRWTDPLAPPGREFHYSDDGYCLLGNMIERITGKPLAAAVHQILDYDKLGLASTWWETKEAVPPGAGPRAHQIFEDGRDTYDWNPSLDMNGGGGLVATPSDMAAFMYDLFEGKVFKHPETLQLMISKAGLPADSPYRMGVFEYEANGVKVYWHSGYWGTAAFYVPSQHKAYAFAVTRRAGYKPAFAHMKAYLTGTGR